MKIWIEREPQADVNAPRLEALEDVPYHILCSVLQMVDTVYTNKRIELESHQRFPKEKQEVPRRPDYGMGGSVNE